MTVSAGDLVPNAPLMVMGASGPETVASRDVLGRGTVVLFAVPGAFTPTCSDQHLPGFVLRRDELKTAGVDTIACVSVNDVFVMDAWARSQRADGILMLADGLGDFATAMGLEMRTSRLGLGLRSRRYAAILRNGRVGTLLVEQGPGLDVSSADAVLASLAP